MENLHTNKKVNQQTADGLHENSPTGIVLALCFVTIIIIAVTTMMLGVSLSKFSDKESNTIMLAPSENVGKAIDKNNTVKSTDNQPEGYHGELNVNDDFLKWSVETNVDLFKDSYDGTVKSNDNGKRIAPGTSNYYDFTVKNDGNIPLDYSISLKIGTFFDGKSINSEIPLEWRLLTADNEVISDWQLYTERSEVLKQATLDLRHQDSYIIEWHWKFERGQDVADTELGNLAVNEPIGVNATIYVNAQQSADWDGKISVLPKTEDLFNPVLYLILLIISICVLLILVVVYKRRKRDENTQDDQG